MSVRRHQLGQFSISLDKQVKIEHSYSKQFAQVTISNAILSNVSF